MLVLKQRASSVSSAKIAAAMALGPVTCMRVGLAKVLTN